MEPVPAKPSALKRFCRKALFVVAALITLIALFFAEENWRGSHEWQNYKRAMEAKGEHFDAARLIPPKVPDDQNFATTPYFASNLTLSEETLRTPLTSVSATEPVFTNTSPNSQTQVIYAPGDRNTNIIAQFFLPNPTNRPNHIRWSYGEAADLIPWAAAFADTNAVLRARQRPMQFGAIRGSPPTNPVVPVATINDPVQAGTFILDNLKPLEPALAELQSASDRPYSRFNVLYEQYDNPQVQMALLSHFVDCKRLDRILTLRGEAEMVIGQTAQALKDITVMFRADDGLKDEPLVISHLVRIACLQVMLQPIGQGLAEHRWSEAQLQALQDRLQKTDLIDSLVHVLHGERDFSADLMFEQLYLLPHGWLRLEQLNFYRAFDEFVLPRIDLAGKEINPSVNHSLDLLFHQSYEGKVSFLHHNIIMTPGLPDIFRVGEKTALAQSDVDMAMLACALERYHLAHNQYPDELNALVPGFVAVLPHDIINGQPLKYRRTDDGRFIIYSVGWNEKDDGGMVAITKGSTPRQDPMQGDWVWQYPPETRKMTKG